MRTSGGGDLTAVTLLVGNRYEVAATAAASRHLESLSQAGGGGGRRPS